MFSTKLSIFASLVLLAACSATRSPANDDPETTRPPLPERVSGNEPSPVPSLRGRAFLPTGTPCRLGYRVADASSGHTAHFETVRGAAHLRVTGEGAEWFFERNSVHHEELTGFRVDVARRKLIEYPFTDLVIDGFARSWSSLARLGIAPEELGALQPTGESVEEFGVRFEVLRNDHARGGELRELRWSHEHQLPLLAERASGWTLRLETLAFEAPDARTITASLAHPSFVAQDVADWREGLHDHLGAATHAAHADHGH
ncbi:MAG: hypothetical protein L6Q99_03045 [Planctomycetes bacterium]|nr:hypothetical protein [Planctomycetota bacterium]